MIHPFLTHFPIVLIVVIAIFEVLVLRFTHLRQSISLLLILYGVSVLGAFFSGYYAAESASMVFTVSTDVIAYHQLWAKACVFLSVPLVILGLFHDKARFHRAVFSAAYRIFLLITLLCMFYTSYLGGVLIFAHGAGVHAQYHVTDFH